jgi:hypothetical protein
MSQKQKKNNKKKNNKEIEIWMVDVNLSHVTCAWCQGASWLDDGKDPANFSILKCSICPSQFCAEHKVEFAKLKFILPKDSNTYSLCRFVMQWVEHILITLSKCNHPRVR